MIDRTQVRTASPDEFRRDERSMRLMEYAMAIIAVAAALLLSIR
ncbi:MAG TPA: hypothetical protein VKA85_04785 [Candidatus Limnocylindrales bacterium]|nr:hypothetical protein [Candidatus Limnocylindrales bacterium]